MKWHPSRKEIADGLTHALQLDVRFYGRSFAWLSFGHVSGVIRGIATTFLMARWLDPVVLGQFRYVLALFGIAGVFAMSGMSAAVIRGVAQGDTIVARLAIVKILRIAPIGSLLLFLIAAERAWAGERSVAAALIIAGLVFTPYALSGLYGAILTGQEKIKELTRIAIINNVLYACAFVSILRLNRNLLTITVAYFGFDLLFRGFLTIRELRRLPVTGTAETHLALGNHLSGIGVMQTIAAQLDQILVRWFGGYQSLALYSVASVIPEQIKDMANSIGGTLLQRLSKREKTTGNTAAVRRHFWIVGAGSVAVIAVYAIVAPLMLPWLFPQYPMVVLPSIIYAIGLIGLPALVGVNFFQAHGDLPRLWRFSSVNAALQIITNIALIPLFGSWGAVWSKTITRIAGLPMSYPTITKDERSTLSKN